MNKCLIAVIIVLMGAPAFAETVLHRGNRSEPASLDPHKVQTIYENNIVQDLFEGLTAYDAAGGIIPAVAKSWDVSADGKRYTFHLRKDLVWSDGSALTADDVVYSYQRLMSPETAAIYAQLFYLVKNGREVNTGRLPLDALAVRARGNLVVEIDLTGPAPYFPQILANGFAAILPRHAIAAFGEDWTAPGKMVSNGAFTLKQWAPQDRIEMERNAAFHDAQNVAVDRVYYYPTADSTSAVARFRAGDLDIQFEFPPEQVKALREMMPDEVRLAPALVTFYLSLNTKASHLGDARVRRALSMAIDRRILTDKVRGIGEPPAMSFVPSVIANYTPPLADFAGLSMDDRRAEAMRLLRAAGYGPDSPLNITYAYSSGSENRRLAVIIAAMWKRVGVETVLLNREGKIHFSSLRQGDFEVGFVGWSADYNDASSFLYVMQSTTVNANYSRYHSVEFDALMYEASQTADMSAREVLMRQAETRMLADQPIIPLYFNVTKYLVARHVKGWIDNPVEAHLSRYLSIER